MQNERWNRLHHLAAELCQLAPWNLIEETDIFGITSPVTRTTWFVSIMGSAGEFRALCAYEGSYALSRFWDLYDNDPTAAYSASVLTIPHMMLSFGSREQTDPEQAALLGDNPEGFDGEWPELKRIVPGLLPETPGDGSLDEFILILEQSLSVLKKALDDLMLLHADPREDVYLVRTQGKGKSKAWKDTYKQVEDESLPDPEQPDAELLAALSAMPKANTVLQWHCQMMPLPLKEKDRPHCFPFMAMLVNKRSGVVEVQNLFTPFPDYLTMMGRLPGNLVSGMHQLGFRPRCIEVMDPQLYRMVNVVLRSLGIGLVFKSHLPETEAAVEAVTRQLRK